MAGNSNLHMSKAGKTDEFYTQLSTIEEELRHYRKYFKGKTVLCNCDDPYESSFFKYFALNFNALGLKKLITTCYATSPITYTQLSLFADEEITYPAGEGKKPYKIEITEVTDANGDATVDLSDVEYLLRNKKNALTLLNEDGDFRSRECIALLNECDIVVTNPPFSLMKEYIPLLAESGKQFLVLGNMNHITFKEIFHYFRENKMWLGYNAGHFWFKVPDYYEAKNTDYKQDEDGQKWRKNELDYISTKLESEYRALIEERYSIAKRLYNGITKLSKIYQSIYTPIQGEIAKLLGDLEDGVMFHAEVFMKDHNLSQNILNYINQRYNGKYGRSHNSLQEIEARIKETDFGNEDSVISFVCDMENVITSELESAENRVPKRQEFYDFIFGLKYIGVNFKLRMGKRSLEELSPGERGIVLLIFYLALSKENKPIIIDQPEDNLDNQSVYSKLVPCICRAKQKRQVIIVTHNPNIAVACDAEQIVFCEKNSDSNEIRYKSGAIENPIIRKHVVDVLEGTMPAFDLRRLKYD